MERTRAGGRGGQGGREVIPDLSWNPSPSTCELRWWPGRSGIGGAGLLLGGGVSACPRRFQWSLGLMNVTLAEKHRGMENLAMTPCFLPFQDDIPGPGFYNVIHQSPVFDSVSLSKKGTCTFPSMVRAPSLNKGTNRSVLCFLHGLITYWTSRPFSPNTCGSY